MPDHEMIVHSNSQLKFSYLFVSETARGLRQEPSDAETLSRELRRTLAGDVSNARQAVCYSLSKANDAPKCFPHVAPTRQAVAAAKLAVTKHICSQRKRGDAKQGQWRRHG